MDSTTKAPWQSKTLWVNVILAVTALVWPAGNAYVQAHPDFVVGFFTVVNIALRLVTKHEISIS